MSNISEFYWAMGRHSTASLYQINTLLRCGRTVDRYATEACNRELKPLEIAKRDRAIKRIHDICKEFGASALVHGDPRGCVVKLVVPDGFTNDFGAEGICVPGVYA